MMGSSVGTGMEDDSHCSLEGLCGRESSNSDRRMPKKLSSSLEAYAVWKLSTRKLTWGKQVKKKSEIIPTQQILCMVKHSSRRKNQNWKNSIQFRIFKKMA
jgi:hypothetical protein